MSNYTIGQLAKLAGVSVKTLHHYDKKGLLSPEYKDKNSKYRFYGKDELLKLQQILFYKELGFSLVEIKKLLNKSSFSLLSSLEEQHKMFGEKIEKSKKLMETIENTIKHLKEKVTMEDKQFFENIKTQLKENPPEYVTHMDKYTDGQFSKECDSTLETLTKEQALKNYEQQQKNFKEFTELVKTGFTPDSAEIQAYYEKSHQASLDANQPLNANYYQGMIDFLKTNKETRKFMDQLTPGFADFVCQAIAIFIKNKFE